MSGQVFCVFYALCGIPLNLAFLKQLGKCLTIHLGQLEKGMHSVVPHKVWTDYCISISVLRKQAVPTKGHVAVPSWCLWISPKSEFALFPSEQWGLWQWACSVSQAAFCFWSSLLYSSATWKAGHLERASTSPSLPSAPLVSGIMWWVSRESKQALMQWKDRRPPVLDENAL